MIGFDENRGNTLLVADGKLDGVVGEPILGREAKLATLLELTAPARHRRWKRRWRSATAPTISR